MGTFNIKLRRTGTAKPAPENINKTYVCCDDAAYSFRYGYNADLLLPEGSVTITIEGGCTPFDWETDDAEYTFADAQTAGRTNVLSASADAASSDVVIITITDACGTELNAYVNNYAPTLPAPDAEPSFGELAIDETVELTSQEAGTTMFYTKGDFSVEDPDSEDTEYTEVITMGTDRKLKAINTKAGYKNSAVGSWIFNLIVATPVIDPGNRAIPVPITGDSITITCATLGASIYYTTDGTTPTNESTLYTGSFTLSEGVTVIKAIAYFANATSDTATAVYGDLWVEVAGPYVSGMSSVYIDDLLVAGGEIYTTGRNYGTLLKWDGADNFTLVCAEVQDETYGNYIDVYRIGSDGETIYAAGNVGVYDGYLLQYSLSQSLGNPWTIAIESPGAYGDDLDVLVPHPAYRYILAKDGSLYNGYVTMQTVANPHANDVSVDSYNNLILVNGYLYRFCFGNSQLLYLDGGAWSSIAGNYSSGWIGSHLHRFSLDGAIYGVVRDSSYSAPPKLLGFNGVDAWEFMAEEPDGSYCVFTHMIDDGEYLYLLDNKSRLLKYTPGEEDLELVATHPVASYSKGLVSLGDFFYSILGAKLYRW